VAEDVSSETFLVAWRRLDEMPEHTLPWLLGVARNLLAKQCDSRQRRKALLDRITAGAAAAAQEQVIWDVAEQVVDKDAALTALASMPEKDLEAMALATWHGLDPQESAAVMGCSVRAYHARLHRARKRLAAALSEESGSRPSVRNAHHRPVREI
jgi:RNA polymerase sigma-70 factor (ECF subfamily)